MTLLGKILTLLILLMSFVFMAMSIAVFATHKNWKEEVEGNDKNIGFRKKLENKIAEHKSAVKELETVKNAGAAESAARRYSLAALQSKATQYEELVSKNQAALDKLMADHANATEALNTAEITKANLTKEVEALRQEIRTAQLARDELFDKAVALTDSFNQLNVTKSRLDERNGQLASQDTRMKMVMDAKGITETTLVDHIPPKVDGRVVKVGAKDLLVLSLGSDVGLKVGHVMDVYRGTTYLGRIVIKETQPDRAVAQIIKEMQRGQIQEGDNVTTKLS